MPTQKFAWLYASPPATAGGNSSNSPSFNTPSEVIVRALKEPDLIIKKSSPDIIFGFNNCIEPVISAFPIKGNIDCDTALLKPTIDEVGILYKPFPSPKKVVAKSEPVIWKLFVAFKELPVGINVAAPSSPFGPLGPTPFTVTIRVLGSTITTLLLVRYSHHYHVLLSF